MEQLAKHGLLSDLFASKNIKPSTDSTEPRIGYSEYAQSDCEYDGFDQGEQFGQWSEEAATSSSYMCRENSEDECVGSISSSLMSHEAGEVLSIQKTTRTDKKPNTQIYSGAQLLVDDSFGSAFVFTN